MPKTKTVADRLGTLMQEKSLEAQDVASRLGVDPSTVYRWMEGETKPYRKNLRLIADTYGYSFEWLVSGKGPKLVEVDGVPSNAAIIIRNAKTNKVWVSVELAFRVRVHEPIDLIQGEGGGGVRVDYEGS